MFELEQQLLDKYLSKQDKSNQQKFLSSYKQLPEDEKEAILMELNSLYGLAPTKQQEGLNFGPQQPQMQYGGVSSLDYDGEKYFVSPSDTRKQEDLQRSVDFARKGRSIDRKVISDKMTTNPSFFKNQYLNLLFDTGINYHQAGHEQRRQNIMSRPEFYNDLKNNPSSMRITPDGLEFSKGGKMKYQSGGNYIPYIEPIKRDNTNIQSPVIEKSVKSINKNEDLISYLKNLDRSDFRDKISNKELKSLGKNLFDVLNRPTPMNNSLIDLDKTLKSLYKNGGKK